MKKVMSIILGIFLIMCIVGCKDPVTVGMSKQEVMDLINEYKKRMEVQLFTESMVPKTTENGCETWILYINTAKSLFINRDDYRPFDALVIPTKWRFYIKFDSNGKVVEVIDKTPKPEQVEE